MKQKLPLKIDSGNWKTGHVQGIAVDTEKGYIYYSFTTVLVKTDLLGNLIGTVDGLVGHLGCIDLNLEDGRVYGSLEFKNDAIGQGVFKGLGMDGAPAENAFYIAIFDVDRIDRPDLNAERDGIMTAVYLPQVANFYEGMGLDGHPHRYACSGVDGTAFGPYFGAPNRSPTMLMVACGIYGDVTRTDNDNQVILCFDWRKFATLAKPLSQAAPHHSGLDAEQICFFYTGNTDWGVQNLCYDPATGYWLVAVYRGSKEKFPNHSMYVIDGNITPQKSPVPGLNGEQGLMLTAAPVGELHASSGVRGLDFPWGSTGIHALGDGRFYFSQNGRTPDKLQYSHVHLYRYTGKAPLGFDPVEA